MVEDPFKEQEDLYKNYKKDNKRRYVISKTFKWDWDISLTKLFRKIFRKKRR